MAFGKRKEVKTDYVANEKSTRRSRKKKGKGYYSPVDFSLLDMGFIAISGIFKLCLYDSVINSGGIRKYIVIKNNLIVLFEERLYNDGVSLISCTPDEFVLWDLKKTDRKMTSVEMTILIKLIKSGNGV
jgi:hypothetical protein